MEADSTEVEQKDKFSMNKVIKILSRQKVETRHTEMFTTKKGTKLKSKQKG